MRRTPLVGLGLVVLLVSVTPATAAAAKRRPDLVVTTISAPPANVAPGGSLTMFDTTKNAGKAKAGKSSSGYYLSTNAAKDAADLRIGTRKVGALKPKKRSAGSVKLTVPSVIANGAYSVLACADDGRKVKESKEKNNCK